MVLLAQAQYGFARIAAAQDNLTGARQLGEMSLASFEEMGYRSARDVKRWLDSLAISNEEGPGRIVSGVQEN